MPYKSNADLPKHIRDMYSVSQQTVFRKTFNSVFAETEDEGKAFAIAHAQAKKAIENEDIERYEENGFNSFQSLLGADIDYEAIEELMRGAFGSSGGKTKVVNRIMMMVPEHQTYVEPFAGGAALFFNKQPSKTEALNDLNEDISYAYHFLKTCTPEEVDALKNKNWEPDKQTFFKLRDAKDMTGRIDRVYRFYYLNIYSYGKNMHTYGYIKPRFPGFFERLNSLKSRLKNAEIYCDTYDKIINKYDSADTFFFLDPPYPAEWAGPEGTKMWGEKQVDEFISILKKLKGKFLVTINNLDWVRKKFEDARFKLFFVPVPRSFNKSHVGKFKRELFVTNYELSDDVKRKVENIDNISVMNSVIVVQKNNGELDVIFCNDGSDRRRAISKVSADKEVCEYIVMENTGDKYQKDILNSPIILMKPSSVFNDVKKIVRELKSSNEYLFDKAYVGKRYCISKKNGALSINDSEGNMATKEEFELFKNEGLETNILSMSNDDFIIDVCLYNNRGTFELYVSDLLYHGSDFTNLPLVERKKFLSRLKFYGNVKEQRPLPVSGDEIETAVKLYSSMYGSSGCYVKRRDSKYVFGESDDWALYSKEKTVA